MVSTKMEQQLVFSHGPIPVEYLDSTGQARTNTDDIFSPLWTFTKGKPHDRPLADPCIAEAIAGLSGFVCSCLFCLWTPAFAGGDDFLRSHYI